MMQVVSMDSCVAIYTYDHSTGEATDAGSQEYSYSGTGPYTVTATFYSDQECKTSISNIDLTIQDYNSCSVGGNPFFSTYSGYGEFVDSFPDAPADVAGLFTLGFETACNTEPLSGYWYSLSAMMGVSEWDVCSSGVEVSCSDGVATYSVYSSADCSGNVVGSASYSDPNECDQYSQRDDDDATGDFDYSADEIYETSYCTAGSDGYTFTYISDDDDTAACFAGSEMVTLESGALKPIADVVVGDRVLASNSQGVLRFSDVISVPHAKNYDRVLFNEISLANGADIRMTGEHMLPVAASCGADAIFAVIAAKDVATNSCVMTVGGQSAVVSNNKVTGTGIYTIITSDEYVVVNNVIASPFAASHAMGNTFYNVYRAMYKYSPGLIQSSLFQSFHATFSHLAMKTW